MSIAQPNKCNIFIMQTRKIEDGKNNNGVFDPIYTN